MLNSRRKEAFIICLCFYPFIIYLTLKAGPFISEGSNYFFSHFPDDIKNHPFRIKPCSDGARLLVGGSLFYFLVCAGFIGSMVNTRQYEEHGSSRWGSISEINKKYKSREEVFKGVPMEYQNMLLTKHAQMGFDFWRPEHQKNANTVIFGGPGTMKSRGYIIPNIMQMNSNYIVTDPKGELATKCGDMLRKNGYKVKVFDISNPTKSICYNPFRYFRNDLDILDFVNNFFVATDEKGQGKGSDPYWPQMAQKLMTAFCLYLWHEAPAEEQNFATINLMNHMLVVSEESDEPNEVDILFANLEEKKPDHIAVGYYKDARVKVAKTMECIKSTLSNKLAYFNLDELCDLTVTDDIDIPSFAKEKTALFCVTPDSKQSLNFLIGTLYQQMFQQLFDIADTQYNGPLPIHIRFLLDEFANIALPDDYHKILSTCRSRNISMAMVLQDKSQIEKIYDTIYRSLIADSSILLFLGSNELETCKYFAELCGKETVYVKSITRSYGAHGGYSVQVSPQQRDLITADELRRKSNNIAVLIIEGEFPIKDNKCNMLEHPRYHMIAEGKNLKGHRSAWKIFEKRVWYEPAQLYDWGSISQSNGSMELISRDEMLRIPKEKVIDLSTFDVGDVKIYSNEESMSKIIKQRRI